MYLRNIWIQADSIATMFGETFDIQFALVPWVLFTIAAPFGERFAVSFGRQTLRDGGKA